MNPNKEQIIQQAIRMIADQDLCKWSDAHDQVTLEALHDLIADPADRAESAGEAEPVAPTIADVLEWAASMATHEDPRTGDWYYDDPHDLAKAIRKGPDDWRELLTAKTVGMRDGLLALSHLLDDAAQGINESTAYEFATQIRVLLGLDGDTRPAAQPAPAKHPTQHTDAEHAAWLAGMMVGNDYVQEAAAMLRRWPHTDVASGYADGWQDGSSETVRLLSEAPASQPAPVGSADVDEAFQTWALANPERNYDSNYTTRRQMEAWKAAWSAALAASPAPASADEPRMVASCCGRSECGGECGREYFGMVPVRSEAVKGVSATAEPIAWIEHTVGGSIEYAPLPAAYQLPMDVRFDLAAPSHPPATPAEPDMRHILLAQIHNLIDLGERYAARMDCIDPDEKRYAEGTVDHARKVIAPFNYNGPTRAEPAVAAQAEPGGFEDWIEIHEFAYMNREPIRYTEKHLQEAFAAGKLVQHQAEPSIHAGSETIAPEFSTRELGATATADEAVSDAEVIAKMTEMRPNWNAYGGPREGAVALALQAVRAVLALRSGASK